jgi:tRNA1(Val) A37 N6-methylase TrmN6
VSKVSELGDTFASVAAEDAFLGGALRIRQPQGGYRAGLDAVLLAATLAAERGERVLDIGAGVGVVGLVAARRRLDIEVTLVERDPGLAALARDNIVRNGFGASVRVILADITRPLRELPELGGLTETFDHALANAPYYIEGRGTSAPNP